MQWTSKHVFSENATLLQVKLLARQLKIELQNSVKLRKAAQRWSFAVASFLQAMSFTLS